MSDNQNHKKVLSLGFRVDTPQLLKEIAQNNGVSALKVPLNVLQHWLGRLSERAIELDDPELNIIMLSMALYEGTSLELIRAIEGQFNRLNSAEVKSNEQ